MVNEASFEFFTLLIVYMIVALKGSLANLIGFVGMTASLWEFVFKYLTSCQIG